MFFYTFLCHPEAPPKGLGTIQTLIVLAYFPEPSVTHHAVVLTKEKIWIKFIGR